VTFGTSEPLLVLLLLVFGVDSLNFLYGLKHCGAVSGILTIISQNSSTCLSTAYVFSQV